MSALTTTQLLHSTRLKPSVLARAPAQAPAASLQPLRHSVRQPLRQPVTAAAERAEAAPDGRTDLGNLVAAAGFAAQHYGTFTVDRTLILKAFALLALGNAVINLLKRSGSTYDHVASVAAPAVLAVYVLHVQVSWMEAAIFFLGWRLAETSEGAVSSYEHVVFLGLMASLAAALYYNYGTVWYVLTFLVINVLRIFGLRGKTSSSLFSLPAVVISGWALYVGRHQQWALLLFLAAIVRSAFISTESLASKVDT